MVSYGDSVKMLDLLIEAAQMNLARAKQDFEEISESLNHARAETDESRISRLLKLKNIARDNYQSGGVELSKLKRHRADLDS